MQADKREDVEEVEAGDIAAIVGLKGTTTGQTLVIQQSNRSRKYYFPEPPVSIAIEPKTKADQEKMSTALQRLGRRRPNFPCKS
jgi:elongation factor G